MKNVKTLLESTIGSIKSWVKEGFEEVRLDISAQSNSLKEQFESDLKALKDEHAKEIENIKSLIKEPDLSCYVRTDDIKESYSKDEIDEIIGAMPKAMDGKDGKDGVDGKDGEDGKSINVSDVEPLIKDLIVQQFSKIELPSDGKDGQNGIDGKDALDIDILPFVDAEKSYPRGTYALYKGGLARAHSQTVGDRGWEVMLNGISSIDFEFKDSKTIVIKCETSNGQITEKEFSIPVMTYKGVFKEGNDYLEGDTVTWGGSVWHCNKDTKEKPGKSSDWTLAVKKGVDAK